MLRVFTSLARTRLRTRSTRTFATSATTTAPAAAPGLPRLSLSSSYIARFPRLPSTWQSSTARTGFAILRRSPSTPLGASWRRWLSSSATDTAHADDGNALDLASSGETSQVLFNQGLAAMSQAEWERARDLFLAAHLKASSSGGAQQDAAQEDGDVDTEDAIKSATKTKIPVPEICAPLGFVLGMMQRYDEAHRLFRAAITQYEAQNRPAFVVSTLLFQGSVFKVAKHYEDAMYTFEEAVERAEDLEQNMSGSTPEEVADLQRQIAQAHGSLGATCVELIRKHQPVLQLEALAQKLRETEGANAASAAMLQQQMSEDDVKRAARIVDRAKQRGRDSLTKAVDMYNEIGGMGSEEMSSVISSVSELYRYTGEFAKAKQLLESHLSFLVALKGQISSDPEQAGALVALDLRIASGLVQLGLALTHLGMFDQATERFQQALGLHQKHGAGFDGHMFETLANLAEVHSESQNTRAHMQMLALLVDYLERTAPTQKQSTARREWAQRSIECHTKLCDMVRQNTLSDREESRRTFAGFLEQLEVLLRNEESPDERTRATRANDLVRVTDELASTWNVLGEYAQERATLLRLLDTFTGERKSLLSRDVHQVSMADALERLAEAHHNLAEYKAEVDVLERLYKIVNRDSSSGGPVQTAAIEARLGGALCDLEEYPEAKSRLTSAVAMLRMYLDEDEAGGAQMHLVRALSDLGRVEGHLGQHYEAQQTLEEALEIGVGEVGSLEHPVLAEALLHLSLLYASKDDMEQAREAAAEAKGVLDKLAAKGTESPALQRKRETASDMLEQMELTE